MLGASHHSNCTSCSAGTWSDVQGADEVGTCNDCPAGTFQPALGQASDGVCIRCTPGKFSSGGAAFCSACPPGTWSSAFTATSCNSCPASTWTRFAGASHAFDCEACTDCGASDLHIQAQVGGVDWIAVGIDGEEAFKVVFAKKLASECGVPQSAVVDLYGINASVTISAGELDAFIVQTPSCTASELQMRLASRSFRENFLESLDPLLREPLSGMTISSVSALLQPFVAMAPTTRTSTSTANTVPSSNSSTSSTSTVTTIGGPSTEDGAVPSEDDSVASTTTSTTVAKDFQPEAKVQDAMQAEKTHSGLPSWFWGLLGGVTVAAMLTLWQVSRRCRSAGGGPGVQKQNNSESGAPVSDHDRAASAGAPFGADVPLPNLYIPRSLSGPELGRTNLDDMEEGEWFARNRANADTPRLGLDCTKGCTIWC